MDKNYDVIVVGAGHAGCEAAAAAANLGSKTLLITMNMGTIAQMSCNPAMGGIAKGQIVREIDAMGGYSGIVSDKSAIQFKMLNRSKGAAMWSPRAQNDRMQFAMEWRKMLEETPNVDFFQDMVSALIVKDGKAVGVRTGLGIEFNAKAVVLTNGTFLNGLIHIGEKQFGGGRAAEKAATGITEQLMSFGFETGRMKTGTPPRVDGRSLDYSKMTPEPGDATPGRFSFTETPLVQNQMDCWLTYTNDEVHDILRTGFDQSPMFTGRIQGLGPRYCPSIEDKIDRFAERDRHQIFVEPEGRNTIEIYVNGFSTSLPDDVQLRALKKIAGFEHVKMFRPGYAIEYDYFPPQQLQLSLETKLIEHLYFAGQINGTTGYEEAAGQGFMAGINAHLKINNQAPLVLSRSQAYIGVLIDDLVTKGTDEPYRMFTSRAEYRILLRQDNADLRLTPLSHALGLASDERLQRVKEKYGKADAFLHFMRNQSVEPAEINPALEKLGSSPINQKVKIGGILSRPQVQIGDLISNISSMSAFIAEQNLDRETIEQAEIQLKYEGYIQKEQENANKLSRLEDIKLRDDFNYHALNSLSTEAKEKLTKIKPSTLGQASRISGISPSDISVLMVYMGR
jgi:tRNA uridine 5-carboxymethylaminomethyl modification enzyme